MYDHKGGDEVQYKMQDKQDTEVTLVNVGYVELKAFERKRIKKIYIQSTKFSLRFFF